MAYVRIPRAWQLPECQATPELVFLNRRSFLKKAAAGGVGVLSGAAGCGNPGPLDRAGLYPAERNPAFALDRPVTDEQVAARINNFYEFSTRKEQVSRLVEGFAAWPWRVEVGGLVEKPRTYDLDELVRRLPLEERLYRFRCVEAWAMAVPWTGFPFRALVDQVRPLSSARHVRLVSFHRPDQAPGQGSSSRYPWPYFEGLTMAEATNELTLLATGIYGHELPVQHGAPVRLVTPWKYGFKSIKSIVLIEFVEEQPPTFWNQVGPTEYDFLANVDPGAPHPRWSQTHERLLGTDEEVPTQLYNGYGEYVAHLY